MGDSDNRASFIMILLFSLIFLVFYFIYLFLISKYLMIYNKTKKLSILWLQYLITFIICIIYTLFYIAYLLDSKGDPTVIINDEQSSAFILLLTIFLVAYLFNVINNLIYDSIISIKVNISLNKMLNINTIDVEELSLRFKNINIHFFDKMQNLLYFIIFGIIDIGLIIAFELEYNNFSDKETSSILMVKNFILYILKLGSVISLILLLVCLIVLNCLKKKFFNKYYYNNDLFTMKIYNMFSNKIMFSSDIIIYKIMIDLIINFPILFFLIFKSSNTFFWIFTEVIIFLYILIFGSLNLKLDKMNEVGKIPKIIKSWFFWKKIHFSFWDNDYKYCLKEKTYKYSKAEKQILKDLQIIDNIDEAENPINKEENEDLMIPNSLKLSVVEDQIINMDKFSIRQTNTNYRDNNTLDFSTTSELYILYKLLMLYFKKNENVYAGVQNKINEDGTPFKQFFCQQNSTKNKKKKFRQTFGGIDISKKNDFGKAIDRMSRISKLNSSNLIKSKKFNESEIFYSLEEKELKEEFKIKFKKEKETIFKIESLEANSFFELFPFFQISIQDIKKSLIPSENNKIYKILKKRNLNQNKNNIESESENNLFYTYNSLLMMEIYDRKEFISSEDLSNFVYSYGTYILETIKNINFSFIPLIIGIFNIEICDENKIVILYRNPLYFTNLYRFNHWINFYITEGPERLKASIIQNDVLDINEIEIKNCLKMNESDYEEILNNLKKDFDFFTKTNIQVYPIIHLFIADENELDAIGKNNDVNESSIMENTSVNQINLSGILNDTDDNINNNYLTNNNIDDDTAYKTESNSLIDKEYYSMNGHNIHTIKIYFTNFFRLNCELNKQKDADDIITLKSNHYCQYLEGQIQNYLTKTTLFEMENNDNN